MNKKFNKTIIALFGLLCVSTTLLAAPNNGNGGKPGDVVGSFVIPANSIKVGACAFDVEWALDGKAKTIKLSGNRTIYTSPRLQVEVTNLSDPTKIVDLTVTGAFHETINANGDRVTIMTGRNLVTDPEAGMALIMGTFSYVVDSAGTLIQPLLGQGKIVDICELIS